MSFPGKLLINKNQFQVLWQVDVGSLRQLEEPPMAIPKKAMVVMKTWQNEGHIDPFLIDVTLIKNVTKHLSRCQDLQIDDTQQLRLLVACGAPLYEGIQVEETLDEDASCDLKIQAPLATVKAWHDDFYIINIRYQAKEKKLPRPNPSQALYVLRRMQLKKEASVFDFLTLSKCLAPPSPDAKGYILKESYKNQGLELVVNNPAYLTDTARKAALLEGLNQKLAQLSKQYKIYASRDVIIAKLKNASHRKEAIGMDMPYSLFLGILQPQPTADGASRSGAESGQKSRSKAKKASSVPTSSTDESGTESAESGTEPAKKSAKSAKSSQPAATKKAADASPAKKKKKKKTKKPDAEAKSAPDTSSSDTSTSGPAAPGEEAPEVDPVYLDPPADYPGKGLIELEISPDKMAGVIVGFKESVYEGSDCAFDEEWLENEMRRLKLRVRNEDLLKRVMDNVKRKRDLNQLCLVAGDIGKAAEEPFLVNSAEVAAAQKVEEQSSEPAEDSGDDQEKKDMRKSVIATCSVGSRVAEWQFKTPAVDGYDIYKERVDPPPPELPNINLGEGVEAAENFTYTATREGLAIVDSEAFSVEVSKVYVTESDVSLVTGNVEFDGSVVVNGFVQSGAMVRATQDITVHGGVSSGYLVAGGNVEVKEGIIKSRVDCKGNVTADFVEHSKVSVKGLLSVKRAAVNNSIVAEKMQVDGDPGMLAGGNLFCNEELNVITLGFGNDNPTLVTMGVDYKLSASLANNESRWQSLGTVAEEWDKQLKLYKSKSQAQLTKAHETHMAELEVKTERISKIRAKIKKRLRALSAGTAKANEDAIIRVKNILFCDVQIKMGNQDIKLLGSNSETVQITYKKKRGSHIAPLEQDTAEVTDGTEESSEDTAKSA